MKGVGWGWGWGLGKSIFGKQNSMNRPSLEKIKKASMARAQRAKERMEQDEAAEGVSKGKIMGNFQDCVRDFGFYPPGKENH